MDATPTLPDYLTDAQVAGWLAIPRAKVRKWAKAGTIPCITLPDGSLLFDQSEIARWVQALPRNAVCGGQEPARA